MKEDVLFGHRRETLSVQLWPTLPFLSLFSAGSDNLCPSHHLELRRIRVICKTEEENTKHSSDPERNDCSPQVFYGDKMVLAFLQLKLI